MSNSSKQFSAVSNSFQHFPTASNNFQQLPRGFHQVPTVSKSFRKGYRHGSGVRGAVAPRRSNGVGSEGGNPPWASAGNCWKLAKKTCRPRGLLRVACTRKSAKS
eukprot:1529220-Alexandrium_andersonii.AAC.1